MKFSSNGTANFSLTFSTEKNKSTKLTTADGLLHAILDPDFFHGRIILLKAKLLLNYYCLVLLISFNGRFRKLKECKPSVKIYYQFKTTTLPACLLKRT